MGKNGSSHDGSKYLTINELKSILSMSIHVEPYKGMCKDLRYKVISPITFYSLKFLHH